MKRTAREKHTPYIRPVEKIELSEKNVKGRTILVVLLFTIAALSFSYGISALFKSEDGWVTIDAKSSSNANNSSEFVFNYKVGTSDMGATAEKKALQLLYTEAMEKAYRSFNVDESFMEEKDFALGNVYDLNHSPNQAIEVSDALYNALEKINAYDSKLLFLGAIVQSYDDLFFCNDDIETVNYDPYQNEELKEEYKIIASYISDPENVSLELLEQNQVILHVSEEYLSYLTENGIENIIDFYWIKNAFIIDFLADSLMENGYTNGTITSYDGYMRNLGSEDDFSSNLFIRDGMVIYDAAVLGYHGKMSMISYRNYAITEKEKQFFYEFQDGTEATCYISPTDGMTHTAVNDLTVYAKESSVSDLLLKTAQLYIADDLLEDSLIQLASEDIGFIYANGKTITQIHDLENSVSISDLYEKDSVSFSVEEK